MGQKASIWWRGNNTSRSSNLAQQSVGKDRCVHATAADDVDDSVTINTVHVPAENASLYYDLSVQVNIMESKPFNVLAIVNKVPLSMSLDTCAEASILSSSLWHRLGKPALTPAPKLRAYGGGEIPALGKCEVEVQYESQRRKLPVVFVESPSVRALFGLPWITAFKAVNVNIVDADSRLSALLEEFRDVFEPSTVCIKGHLGHLYFKDNVMFKINKPRTVPYAYRPLVEAELERLVQQGVLTPVDVAEFS